MTLEEALFSRLSGYAGLAALVSDRIYPLTLPQNVTLPAATYHEVSGTRVHAMVSDTGLAGQRIQVSCWGSTYSSVKSVAAQVRAALQDFTGLMGGAGGVTVQRSFLENEIDLPYESDPKVFHTALDFVIWFIEG